ncbi:IS110 family transposase [Streptomyces sp. NPDC001984]
MTIVGGLDVHRRQVTFDCLDSATGQVRRGRIAPATRGTFRSWLEQLPRPAVPAVEGCTGWRFIVEECQAAGVDVQLAEPADTAAADGPKHRAKTDRADARKIRELLADGRLPQSWIPPQQVLEMRTLLRLYKDLRDEHTAWVQRIHATLFHHGVPAPAGNLLADDQRARLVAGDGLSPPAHQAVLTALRTLDALDGEMAPLRRQLGTFARRQPGCAVLLQHYGVGPITAVAIWAELGDARRFSSSRQAVRHAGLDVTVYSSDDKRSPGRLARQGPPLLRWALFEAAKCAARPGAPDYAYYQQVKERCGGNRAALSVARKLVRRAHHALRALGDEALIPA